MKSAQKNAAENQKNICEMNEHVAKNNNANDTLSKNSSCEHCTHHDQQITNIMELISKIKDKQQEESQQTLLRAAEQEAKIQTLTSENIKMAAEIQALNITVEELSNDNNHIKCILDYKQNEWTKIEEKKKVVGNAGQNTSQITTDVTQYKYRNPFSVLHDQADCNKENSQEELEERKENEIHHRHPKQNLRFKRPKKSLSSQKKKPTHHEQETNSKPNDKSVLVIGDSMVKNIDQSKIGRAARSNATCHSYSGATVEQINQKLERDGNHGFHTVILHVGTNDLVRKEPEEVATNMEILINKVKAGAKEIAVSGVVRRHDGRISNKKIDKYNQLLHDLSYKHKISFINNDCIDKSLLNGSKLHLNRMGDRALGSAFCTFLKSNRMGNTNMASSHNDNHFFRPTYGRQKDWTIYLSRVKQMLKQKLH